jgi:hypothetical protein
MDLLCKESLIIPKVRKLLASAFIGIIASEAKLTHELRLGYIDNKDTEAKRFRGTVSIESCGLSS